MHEINIFFVTISFAELLMFAIECGVKFAVKIADCGQVLVIGCVGHYQVDGNFTLCVVAVTAYGLCTVFGRRLFRTGNKNTLPGMTVHCGFALFVFQFQVVQSRK